MPRNDPDFKEDYVPVNERIRQFREKYPDGRIVTERQDVEGGVSFKTLAYRDKEEVIAATGHSFIHYDERDDGEKVEEYAETVSIGRALANLGFEILDGLASKEEMDKFNKNQSKKKTRYQDDEEDDEEDDDEPPFEEDDEEDDADEEEEVRPRRSKGTKLKTSRTIKRGSRFKRK